MKVNGTPLNEYLTKMYEDMLMHYAEKLESGVITPTESGKILDHMQKIGLFTDADVESKCEEIDEELLQRQYDQITEKKEKLNKKRNPNLKRISNVEQEEV